NSRGTGSVARSKAHNISRPRQPSSAMWCRASCASSEASILSSIKCSPRPGRLNESKQSYVQCCGQAPMSSAIAPTCRRVLSSPNTSTSPTPSSIRTRPVWSMPCSIRSRGDFAPGSSRRSAGEGDIILVGRRKAAMNRGSAAQSGEERLIARYFAPLAKHAGAFGLADDAAAITPPAGCDLVLKTDGIVAGVHFFPDDPPDTVAKKALRTNLSDLAANGAKPLGFLLTLALPEGVGDAWLAPFARGLGVDAEAFGCPLLGGDTDRTGGPITISIAALGAVPQGKMLRRTGAQAGDRVVVTGTIGDAALGLQLRRDGSAAARWGLARAA